MDANGQPIDWNGENGTGEVGVPADINWIDSIGDKGKGCNIQSTETLNGHDDWANIQYNPVSTWASSPTACGRTCPRR